MSNQSIESKAAIFPFVWFLVLLFIPLLSLFAVSFFSAGAPGSFPLTLRNYSIVSEIFFLKPLVRSAAFASMTTFLAFIIGLPVALWIAGLGKNKLFFLFLVLLPFWTNFLVRMYGWKMLLRENGILDFIGLGSPLAVLTGLLYFYLPLMVVTLYVAIEKFDWRIALAAKDLGAGSWVTLIEILIPLIMPGIKTGALFVFVLSFGDFVVSDILGGAKNAMVGNSIRDAFLLSRNWPLGAAMTILIAILAFFSIYILKILKRNPSKV